MSIDGLVAEYLELEGQLRGISPKLSLHATINARVSEIREQLGFAPHSGKQRGIKTIESASGVRLKIKEGQRGKCSAIHTPVPCIAQACNKAVKLNGKCHACGQQKYKTYCTDHGARS